MVNMLMGGSASAMMDQDEASFIQAQSVSSGRLGLHGQSPIPFVPNAKGTFQMEMMSDDPNMCHFVAGLQKDFKDCHL